MKQYTLEVDELSDGQNDRNPFLEFTLTEANKPLPIVQLVQAKSDQVGVSNALLLCVKLIHEDLKSCQ